LLDGSNKICLRDSGRPTPAFSSSYKRGIDHCALYISYFGPDIGLIFWLQTFTWTTQSALLAHFLVALLCGCLTVCTDDGLLALGHECPYYKIWKVSICMQSFRSIKLVLCWLRRQKHYFSIGLYCYGTIPLTILTFIIHLRSPWKRISLSIQ
jgi:hypothetical protein